MRIAARRARAAGRPARISADARARARSAAVPMPCTSSGSLRSAGRRCCRGLSEPNGSWKTICMRRRSGRSGAAAQRRRCRRRRARSRRRSGSTRRRIGVAERRLAAARFADERRASRRARRRSSRRRPRAPRRRRRREVTSTRSRTASSGIAPAPARGRRRCVRPPATIGGRDAAAACARALRAARREGAAGRPSRSVGTVPAISRQRAVGGSRRLRARRRRQQAARIGMPRAGASSVARRPFSTMRPAYITATRSAISRDDAEIVGDQQHRHAELGAAGRRSSRGSAPGR